MRILFVGVNWITKQIITQMLFEDSEEELEFRIIGQDTSEWFWTEFPQLKTYMGDERVDYRPNNVLHSTILAGCDAIYITNCEPSNLDRWLEHLAENKYTGPIILASSWQVYGFKKKKRTPILETERELNPDNRDAKNLLELEKVMLKYKNLQTVILRYSEVFGPYMPEGSEIINMMRLTAVIVQE